MGKTVKDLIYTTIFGKLVPLLQHEKKNGSMAITGENNPLPVTNDSATPLTVKGTNADGSSNVSLMGSYVGYSNKPKPTPPNRTDVTYSLLELDTKLIYIWDGTTWVVW